MKGSIVDFQPLRDSSGYTRFKGFIQIQRRSGVDIQVVHNQHNFFTVMVMNIHQFPQKMGEIYCSPGVSQFHHSFARQWLEGDK